MKNVLLTTVLAVIVLFCSIGNINAATLKIKKECGDKELWFKKYNYTNEFYDDFGNITIVCKGKGYTSAPDRYKKVSLLGYKLKPKHTQSMLDIVDDELRKGHYSGNQTHNFNYKNDSFYRNVKWSKDFKTKMVDIVVTIKMKL